MGSVIGELLPFAVGIAISPVPIIAVILMLLGKRAGGTSVGFAIGWVVGIAVATILFVIIGGALGVSSDSASGGGIKLALGILLIAAGIREWKRRSPDAPPPKWMSAIDEMTSPTAAGIGFALAAVNPKNLLMCIAAGVAVGGASLSLNGEIVAVAVFVVISATTVIVPVIGYLVAAQKLAAPLGRVKTWLEENSQTVMAVLVLVIGAVLIGKGISAMS